MHSLIARALSAVALNDQTRTAGRLSAIGATAARNIPAAVSHHQAANLMAITAKGWPY